MRGITLVRHLKSLLELAILHQSKLFHASGKSFFDVDHASEAAVKNELGSRFDFRRAPLFSVAISHGILRRQ
jgi:hypothetical protein